MGVCPGRWSTGFGLVSPGGICLLIRIERPPDTGLRVEPEEPNHSRTINKNAQTEQEGSPARICLSHHHLTNHKALGTPLTNTYFKSVRNSTGLARTDDVNGYMLPTATLLHVSIETKICTELTQMGPITVWDTRLVHMCCPPSDHLRLGQCNLHGLFYIFLGLPFSRLGSVGEHTQRTHCCLSFRQNLQSN